MSIGRSILRSPRLLMGYGAVLVLMGIAILLALYVIFPDPDAAADDFTVSAIAVVAIVGGAGVFGLGYRKNRAAR